MNSRNIRVNDWLKGSCQFKGCIYNDGFGSCLAEDTDFIDKMLDKVHESYKNDQPIPDDKTFTCTSADFKTNECEYCGSELIEHKEYPTGEKQFLPVTYTVCSNKECEESAI